MTVKLGEWPKFDPDQFKGQETFDPLGSYITRTHRITEEFMKTPEGHRVWGVECVRCRHGYIITDGQRARGGAEQPCKCTMRKNR